MTSANLSEEPIAIKNEEAKNRLSSIADAFLLHDREILIRADDSVGIIINKNERLIRRSRGYVPKPLLIENLKSDILAVGAELKNTVCLTSENKAFMSQHIGDLTNYTAYKFFEETISHLPRIMDVKPEYIVHDMYPDYLSRKWAKQQNFSKTFAVQHHHAHMGAVMAENGLDENVIGVMLDGTGYGYDGTIWGGEIFIGNYTALKRFAHLEPLKLPGGDTAVKEPWRIAYSYLYNAFDGVPPQLKLFEDYPIDTVRQMLDKNINSPVASSMGRLFDAVSVLAGGPASIRYEAEAAIRLMHSVESLDFQPYRIKPITDSVIPVKNLIKQVYKDVIENKSIPEIAAKFHLTITDILIDAVTQAYHDTGIKKIALSGGVFQNEVLLTLMENKLRKKNFEVYSHSKLPTNDGSISFGQAVIAGQLLNQNMEKVNYST
jgi:hydrogenase maturation protein HypF